MRAFQLHLVAGGISWAGLNQIVCAVRFFYGATLGRGDLPERIAYAREPRKLPVVLGAEEVVRFLAAVTNLKHRIALTTAYAAGLRAAEAASLKLADIDSSRMMIRVDDQLGALTRIDWVVYAKPPFAGPEQVLGYLGRYTHRVAIANSRLVELSDGQVSFTWKDYRQHGKTKLMTLAADEFLRRFLQHTVPDGFHRIRHIGFLANRHRTAKLALCRNLLAAPPPDVSRRAGGKTDCASLPARRSMSVRSAAARCYPAAR